MRQKRIVLVVFCVFQICASAFLTSARAQAADEYKFIQVRNSSTLERELNQFAVLGWRLFIFPKAYRSDMIAALLSRPITTKPSEKYEYLVLAVNRLGTLEQEFKEATSQGYEFRSICSLYREGDQVLDAISMSGGGGETLIVMERQKGNTSPKFEYQLLSVKWEGTLQKELSEAVTQGYRPLEMVRTFDNSVKRTVLARIVLVPGVVRREERTLIIARELTSPSSFDSRRTKIEYKFLATKRVATMESEMNEAAKLGYRFYSASPEMLTLMQRDLNDKITKQRYEYKILATRLIGTMQKEIDQLSEQGFIYQATSSSLNAFVTILERELEQPRVSKKEYGIAMAWESPYLDRLLRERVNEGFQIRDITRSTLAFLMVFDRDKK